jgi:hypothetical protein
MLEIHPSVLDLFSRDPISILRIHASGMYVTMAAEPRTVWNKWLYGNLVLYLLLYEFKTVSNE